MKSWWWAMVVAATLAACAHAPEQTGDGRPSAAATPGGPQTATGASTSAVAPPESGAAASSGAAAPNDDDMPEVVNYTDFFSVLLIANDKTYGDYFSFATKVSYDIGKNGRLALSDTQEAVLDGRDDIEDDFSCTEKGGNGNQRTTWFSDTAILVAGGRLQSVRLPGAKAPARLHVLTPAEDGALLAQGEGARDIEYAYVPCVAQTRVAAGHRIDGFAPSGTVLTVKTDKGRVRTIELPDKALPFMLLRYRMGAMIPTPMRIVLITVDLEAARVVLHYQTTFPMTPPLRKVELRAIVEGQGPSKGESRARFEERTRATVRDLARCAVPREPIEPCSSHERHPDRLIFRSTLK